MAKTSSNNAAIFLLLIVAISLLSTVASAKSDGSRLGIRSVPAEDVDQDVPRCEEVHGVKSGESCMSIADAARMTWASFYHLNPNINCDAIFVGQWICIRGIQ